MAKKKNKKKKGLFGLFGGGKDEPEEATTPGGEKLPEHDMTIMPDYAQGPGGQGPEADPGIGEMTMAPGYVQHFQPESSGEIGAVSFGSQTPGSLNPSSPGDEFVAGEMTMAPGYAADLGNQSDYGAPRPGGADPFADPPPGGGPDPFGAALGGSAAPDPFGDPLGPGPGGPDPFTDAIPSAAGGAAPDPFGDPMGPTVGGADPFALGLPPAAEGGDPLGAATPMGSQGVDPTAETFAVPGGGEPEFSGMDPAEMTMVPGYAGGDLGTRGDWAKPPAGGTPGPGEADPFAADLGAGELTMAPGYAGATPAGQAPSDEMFPGGEMTMAPGYAGGGLAGPADPFGADLGSTPGGASVADPFGADLGAGELTMAPSYSAQGGGPTDLFGGPDPFGGDLGGPSASPSPAEAAALGADADPNDPFGPALLDQPKASIGADEFAERTMVDMPGDIAELEVLRPTTEELQLEELGLADALGGTREIFSSFRREGQEAVASGLAGEVHHDIQRGLIFAAPVDDGWRVLPGLRRLSDGSLVGSVRVDESGEFRWGIPLEAELIGGVLHVSLPSGAQHDPETRALRIPQDQAAQLAWRPARTWRDGEGALCFLLPPEVTLCEGRLEVPQDDAPPAVEIDPALPHGALVSEQSYLGLTERAYADGWTSLELGPGAEITSEGLEVDLSAVGTRPALLEVEELPCGLRGRVALPPLARNEDGLLWLPPLAAEELAEEEGLLELTSVRESRTYLGLRDELLESGWVRLVLPESASVSGGVLTLKGSGEDAPASIRSAFDLNAEGALTFTLPDGFEVLGNVVLIPPGGNDLVTDTWSSPSQNSLTAPDPGPRRWSARDEAEVGTRVVQVPAEVRPPEPALDASEETVLAPPAEEPVAPAPAEETVIAPPAEEEPVTAAPAEVEHETSGEKKSKKLSGLARFRGSKPENDVVEFSGVLEPSDESQAPAAESEAPAAESEAPAAESEVPEDEVKVSEDEVKVSEDEVKASEDEAKVAEDESEVPADEAKAAEDEVAEAPKPKPKPKRKTRKRTSRKKKTE